MSTLPFPDIEADYGASKQAQPNVRVAEFGSGYSQRATFGINQDKKVWQLQWQNRSATDTNNIEDFLEARAGVEVTDGAVKILWEKTKRIIVHL